MEEVARPVPFCCPQLEVPIRNLEVDCYLVNLQQIVRPLTLEVPLSLGFGAVQKRACDF